ncbi:PREDICTED: uncharacterized protein LOC109189299 [Ipomoea nil]|uniref:uncharacterized protein LOC109189299 n=1 Tax=Ipomoea nil TaxID=35883 RepID=UPI000901114E|nr:PREDICTED: uncharacterized protein LOC109189299 [Ipomoea nil]
MGSLGLNLCQRKYALDILHESRFLSCKPASTPMITGQRLDKGDGVALSDPGSYRQLVGRLLYLTATRPEISYAVQQLSQFVDVLTSTHMSAAHHVLRYIKRAPRQGIFYPKGDHMQLNVFSDSDWVTCSTTRKSITGFCVFLGKAFVSWRSKKQATADLERPSTLFCDNKSAMAIAENHVFHEKTKHIEIDCHIVRDKVAQGLVKLLYIPSSSQIADGFTKALPTSQFALFVSKLGVQNLHTIQLRGVLEDETYKENKSVVK